VHRHIPSADGLTVTARAMRYPHHKGAPGCGGPPSRFREYGLIMRCGALPAECRRRALLAAAGIGLVGDLSGAGA
jgi:hypothetical protein